MTLRAAKRRPYAALAALDGHHPLKSAVPSAYVDYEARRRFDADVAYLNFDLAREMGLLPAGHGDRLDAELRRALLDAFALVIINERDLLDGRPVRARERRPGRFMATRYLQLQHPGRLGRTSGDGRSIWNGIVRHRGRTWDVSSCGTGVTCLAPATAERIEFFRTGTRLASYGCGTATLEEGISAALMSETFHRNGIATERVLAVLDLPRGQAITVRAAPNLLRPSHFFVHLRQNDGEALRALVDLFIERQVENGAWPDLRGPKRRYDFFAREMARTFARTCARFESDYIFCWLDWDGDNVLANGGIIDYGSVRQFGLYHREYRFDDGPRWSTTLQEQRAKGRDLVRCFAQIRDFVTTGRKRPLAAYGHDRTIRAFDAAFREERDRLLLRRVGFEPDTVEALARRARPTLARFRRAHAYFERARSARGRVRVPDGLSWNAIFCTRDLLRELPERYRETFAPVPAKAFLAIAASRYASRRDRAVTVHRARMAAEFQRSELALIERAAALSGRSRENVLRALCRRSSRLNRAARITGNGIDHATGRLLRERRALGPHRFQRAMRAFIAAQDLDPDQPRDTSSPPGGRALSRVLEGLFRDVDQFRHDL